MFNNKSILITGGTGSFGKNFTKFLLKKYKLKKIIIYSRDEMKQFEMSQFLSTKKYNCLRYFIGDVRDLERLTIALRGVDYVIHAAALKQVPAAEYNPIECIKTNIIGAQNIILASLKNNVKKVISLSTDKAVNPINLYGSSKLASDKLIVSGNNYGGSEVKFSVVRYGNVIGSRASVVPFFKKLIDQKSKFLPITNTSMTRFWITINEGINLVHKAFNNMIGGEIYVPKIPSIKIVDLAKAMAPNLKHKIIGIRPGEKIHELLTSKDEAMNVIRFKDHYVITPNIEFKFNKSKYLKNKQGEIGKFVENNFEYNSGTNKKFLNIKEIKKLNENNPINDSV
jgi:UDP-N-acetylglucosamine 4,6-dehydratase